MTVFPLRQPVTESLWQRMREGLPPAAICLMVGLVTLLIPALLLRFSMPMTIGAVVGLVGMSLVIACPYLGLLIFLGLLYLRPEEIFPMLAGARMTLMVSLAVLFAWTINSFLCRESFRLHLPAVKCFIAFLVVAVGSTLISGSGRLSEEALELLKLLILFVLIVHLVNSERRLRTATACMVLFTAILGARTIWQYQNGEALVQSDGQVRALATGIFGDPNDLALAMAMALPLTLGAIFGAGGWWARLWNLAAVPILIWTIFVTNSRGGVLALAAAVLFFFGRRLGKWGLIVGVVAALGLFTFGPSRMSEMSSDEESAQGRVLAWEAGLKMLEDSPVWGIGKGQFVEHHGLTAHNSLMLCLSELGLFGTACWIGLFYFSFRNGRRTAAPRDGPEQTAGLRPLSVVASRGQAIVGRLSASTTMALQISLVAFMVGGFFLSRTFTPPLYVYLALTIAASQVEAEAAGLRVPPASSRDWLNIAGLTLAGLVVIRILVHLWG